MLRAGQHRPRVVAGRFEQRGQQGVLVFAVAVLVLHHVVGGVRLVTPYAEGDTDIPVLRRDISVDRRYLIFAGDSIFD
jgi:hypothetical protein